MPFLHLYVLKRLRYLVQKISSCREKVKSYFENKRNFRFLNVLNFQAEKKQPIIHFSRSESPNPDNKRQNIESNYGLFSREISCTFVLAEVLRMNHPGSNTKRSNIACQNTHESFCGLQRFQQLRR